MQAECKIKFSCDVPANLYLKFTLKAREKQFNKKKSTRGAITKAIIEAMEIWLKQDNNESKRPSL